MKDSSFERIETKDKSETEDQVLLKRNASLVIQWYLLFKIALIHNLNNQAFLKTMTIFLEKVNAYSSEISYKHEILFTEESAFVNETLLKVDAGIYKNLMELKEILERVNIGEIKVNGALQEEDVIGMLTAYKGHYLSRKSLSGISFGPITLKSPEKVKEIKKSDGTLFSGKYDKKKNIIRLYGKSIFIIEKLYRDISEGRTIKPSLVRRVVQEIVDLSTGSEYFFLGLVQLKDTKPKLATHAVNVAILAMVIGRALDFNKKMLMEICLNAVFHDIGKIRLKPEIAMETKKLSDYEKAQIKEIGASSATILLSQSSFNLDLAYWALVSYELYSLKVNKKKNVSYIEPLLTTQIIAIVDMFEHYTTESASSPSVTPDEALRRIEEKANQGLFHKDLVKLFVRKMGVYPVGTLVELSNGDICIVFNTHEDPSMFDKPVVKLIQDSSGRSVQGRIMDLSTVTGTKIVRSLNNASIKEPVSLPQFFFA